MKRQKKGKKARSQKTPRENKRRIWQIPSFARLCIYISQSAFAFVRAIRRRRNGGWWSKGEEESGSVVRCPGCLCFSPSSQGWQRFCPMVLSLSLDICFLYMVLYFTLLPLDGLLYLIVEDVIWVLGIRSEECKKDVPVVLISMHSCTLDAKIKLNLGKFLIHLCSR